MRKMQFGILIISMMVFMQSLNAKEDRKGFYSGFGLLSNYVVKEKDTEVDPTFNLEFGYRITDKWLTYVYYEKNFLSAIDIVGRTDIGLGASYYMNDYGYFNFKIAKSTLNVDFFGLLDIALDAMTFGVGYGLSLSKRSSIEFAYARNVLDDMEQENLNSNIFTLAYKYRYL